MEGRRRYSLGTAVGVERSGHSSAVRSQAKTEVEGSRVTIVEEGSQATPVEVVERLLLCELGASGDKLWEEHTVPAIWGCCSKSQCILPVQRDSQEAHEESIHPGKACFGRSLGVGTTWRLLEARMFLLGASEVYGLL